jgi:hypothetical protein
MKIIHIMSPFLSRIVGGVFTVIKALKNNKSQLTKKDSFFLFGDIKIIFVKKIDANKK